MARVNEDKGRPDVSVKEYKAALDIYSLNPNVENRTDGWISALHNVANTHLEFKKPANRELAKEALNQALTLQEEKLKELKEGYGARPEEEVLQKDIAVNSATLAGLMKVSTKQEREAKLQAHIKAHRLLSAAFGATHDWTVDELILVGRAHHSVEGFESAVDVYDEVEEMLLGREREGNFKELAAVLVWKGEALMSDDLPEEALEVFKEAQNLLLKNLADPVHSSVANVRYRTAVAKARMEKMRSALASVKEAVRVWDTLKDGSKSAQNARTMKRYLETKVPRD